jgi:hypothetical protein
MHPLHLLVSLSPTPVPITCAASLRGGDGVSRVAPSGPRRPTKEGGGEGRGPIPAGSPRSGGGTSAEPSEASPVDRQGQVPGLGVGSVAVELLSADRGLSGCLAADPQGAPDLGPTGSLGTGGVDHQSCGLVEGFSGVSQALEVVHGSLRSSAGGIEGADGLSDPPAGVGACLGAHVNGSCHRWGPLRESFGKQGFTPQECTGITANWQLATELSGGGVGAPPRDAPLISSCISRREHPSGSLVHTTENESDPREVAASGGQITSQDK